MSQGIRLGRRAFLALAGAYAIGGVAAARAQAQQSPPSDTPFAPSPTTSDPIGDQALALDLDLERIFRFVSDEIRYEPYAGVLRGAGGTLAQRAGNSADQAVLLAALLGAAAIPVRFASGALDAAAIDGLLAATRRDADGARAEIAPALIGPSDGPLVEIPDPSIVERISRPGATPEEVGAWVSEHIDGTVAELTRALADAGITLPETFEPMPELERDQHLWVQAANGAEWLDLDPSQPGQALGAALTTVATTLDSLPEALWHQVELAVIVETVSSGALAESVLLRVPATTDAITDAPITFVNVLPGGLQAVGVAIADELAGWKTYHPILAIGEDGYAGQPMQFGVRDGVFAVDGGTPDQETTAQWLQLTVTPPDREPVVVRRTIFDRVGDMVRGSGSFDPTSLAPIELVALGPDLPAEYAPARDGVWLTVTTGAPTAERFATQGPTGDLGGMAVLAQAYQLGRELMAGAFGVDRGVRTFASGPNVASVRVAAAADAGVADGPLSLDLWHRSFGQLPVEGARASASPALLSGVISHVAERLLLESPAVLGTDPGSVGGASVGAVFEAAIGAGIPLRVVVGSVPDDLGLAPEVAARLAARLAQGWVAVLPEGPVHLGGRARTGWWLIDPETSAAIDEMDDGRGAAAPQYAVTLTPAQAAAEALQATRMACYVAGVAAVVAAIFALESGILWALAIGSGVEGWGAILLLALTTHTAILGTGAVGLHAACGI